MTPAEERLANNAALLRELEASIQYMEEHNMIRGLLAAQQDLAELEQTIEGNLTEIADGGDPVDPSILDEIQADEGQIHSFILQILDAYVGEN